MFAYQDIKSVVIEQVFSGDFSEFNQYRCICFGCQSLEDPILIEKCDECGLDV